MLQTLTDSYNFTNTLQKSSSDVLAKSDVDDTPVDGETAVPISSNWAYDHAALTTAHSISSFGATLVDDSDAATARVTLDLTHAYYLAAINFGALI